MNECLTTPQHEKQISYWVSEKGKRMKWLLNIHKDTDNEWDSTDKADGETNPADVQPIVVRVHVVR